uniref:Uncharacterized protein n=1 Tax=Timema monikensis TaxID=170555 RepID=A0A7R9EEK7_9NEOP|nr:unnamed protein product [Timema monikensis]
MVATTPYLILPLTLTTSAVIFRCFQHVRATATEGGSREQTRATRDVRDLYELLLQKEALENRLGQHEVVRKSNRSPSLRLRFGRRADPSIAIQPGFKPQPLNQRIAIPKETHLNFTSELHDVSLRASNTDRAAADAAAFADHSSIEVPSEN